MAFGLAGIVFGCAVDTFVAGWGIALLEEDAMDKCCVEVMEFRFEWQLWRHEP